MKDKWKEIKGKLTSINKKKKIAVSGIAVLLIAVLAIGGTWGCQKADVGNTVKAESASTIKKGTASGTGSTDSVDETEEKSKDTETDSEEKRTEEKKTSTSSDSEEKKTEEKKAGTSSDSEEKKTAANTSSSPKATSGSSTSSGATSTSGNSGSSGSSGTSGSNSSGNSGTPGSGSSSHTHNWKPVYTTVHHNAVYETRTVVDSPAWDETVNEPVYEMQLRWYCSTCGADITSDPGGHLDKNWNTCGGYYSSYEQVQTGTNTYTVHHDAVTHTEQVKVKDAWDEQVLSGYRCSCGATK